MTASTPRRRLKALRPVTSPSEPKPPSGQAAPDHDQHTNAVASLIKARAMHPRFGLFPLSPESALDGTSLGMPALQALSRVRIRSGRPVLEAATTLSASPPRLHGRSDQSATTSLTTA